MSENNHISDGKQDGMSRKKTLLISLVILIAGGIITTIIFMTEPTAKREGATKETAMLVDAVRVQRGNYRPEIVATGTVIPSRDIILMPRVSGEVIMRSESFIPGGFIEKGELLLRIDPSDYQNTLQLRKSELHQAEADLNIEMGRQDVARKDYNLIGKELAEENEALVLREPQLKSVKSRVEAARAAVSQAELDLQRTAVRAPFDAHILSRNVNVGSQVASGENLGRLVGMDTYWIETSVPLAKIRWLSFPGDGKEGSPVSIRNRTAWNNGEYRSGYLYRLIGALENQTRLARVLVEVKDPLAHKTGSAGLPQLMIGSFVEVIIQAEEIKDVVRLNRDYVRKDEKVWVMKDGKLNIREVDIFFRDSRHAYITSGLEENDMVVTTNLSTVAEGSALRTETDSLNNQENAGGRQ